MYNIPFHFACLFVYSIHYERSEIKWVERDLQ